MELPVGKAEPGEDLAPKHPGKPKKKTGWQPGQLRPVLRVEPSPGISDSGPPHLPSRRRHPGWRPTHAFESSRIDWIPLDNIPALIARDDTSVGTTLAALLYTTVTFVVFSPHLFCGTPPSSMV
jgi:hypothetical protein